MLASAIDIFKPRRREAMVAPGAVFQHRGSDATEETARVISVGNDKAGIAHVRFRVTISRADVTFVDEVRILSLESFRQRFEQPHHPA